MNNIVFKHVSKAYGTKPVVHDLNFTINEGERLILLGPSGCGKTTTLRMIAGLEDITGGTLEMGGRIVNDVAPGERNIAMVFQNYALFPHMTVWENIVFGLKLQKLPQEEIAKRAKEALAVLNLDKYGNAKPKELSGGQKQRVALARALVKQSPYFLLDEPLSNLDAQLRQQARTELVKIHHINRPTMVYVTHDQIEAMTVAHRIAVLQDGVLQQVGSPQAVYHKPINTFVASFIGTPPMNLLNGKIAEGKIMVGNSTLALPANRRDMVLHKDHIILGIRPELCEVSVAPMVQATSPYMENLGNQKILKMDLGTQETCYVSTQTSAEIIKAATGFSFSWADVCFFDPITRVNLDFINN